MSLPDLFLKDTIGFDESLTKLPQDMDLWAEKIITIIKQKVPEAKELKISVSFLKTSEELGVATGAVTLFDRKINKKVHLPIIVKNFTMYPLDIMMVGSSRSKDEIEIVPFDLDTFRESLENSSAFSALSKPLDRLKQMYMNPGNPSNFPPSYRNVYASAGSMLTSIKDTVDDEDVDELKESIKKNPEKLKNYEANSHLDLLGNALRLDSGLDDEDASEKLKDKDTTKIAMIRKFAGNKAEIISVGDQIFAPTKVMTELPAEVESSNEALFVRANIDIATAKDVIVTGDPDVIKGVTIKSGAMKKYYAVVSTEDYKGITHRGILFKEAINPVTTKVSGSMFLNSEFYSNSGSIEAQINGTNEMVSRYLQFTDREDAIIPGNKIALHVVLKDEGLERKTHITIPLEIQKVVDAEYSIEALCSTELGEKLILNLSRSACGDSTMPGTESKDIFGSIKNEKIKTIYVSGAVRIVVLGRSIKLSGAPSDVIKTASRSTGDKVRIISGNGDYFAIKGGETIKMAKALNWDSNNLLAEEVSFILAAKDCPLTKIATALKIAGSHIGETAIYGLRTVVFEKAAKKEEDSEKLKEKKKEVAKKLKCNLFKEASAVSDGQVVDSILSLNFINDKNLSTFLNFIPLLKQSASALARLVLASRLGVEEISNNDVTTAMHKVTDVIKGLEKVRGMNEKNASIKVASISKIEQSPKEGISFLDFL